jgi:hypothetical protein
MRRDATRRKEIGRDVLSAADGSTRVSEVMLGALYSAILQLLPKEKRAGLATAFQVRVVVVMVS